MMRKTPVKLTTFVCANQMMPCGNFVRGVNEGCPLPDSTLPQKKAAWKWTWMVGRRSLPFWVSTYFAEAKCLFLRGSNEWKISTSTALRIVFKESRCCPLKTSCTSWYGIYVDIPLFTGFIHARWLAGFLASTESCQQKSRKTTCRLATSSA